jgi:predicted AAA+ superfamily ATPase
VLDRLIAPRLRAGRKSVLLLGARQVGKSTLARSLGPNLVINLADEATYLAHAKDPGLVARELRALRSDSLVVLDEIQRLPSVLNTLQALLDGGMRHRLILTGSSARQLKRGGANLLPGRVVLEHLDPLTIWELGDRFDLELALRIGTLPGIYLDPGSAPEVLAAYAIGYLREEIQAEALLRDVGSYARFLDAAAAASGQWMNYSKLASDTEIPKETIRRFFQILEDTLLAFRIPPFTLSRARRRVSQRDRFVFFDLGVRNALLDLQHRAPSPTDRASLLEQWVILQCVAFARAHRLPWRASSYRTEAGAEVDLVIDTGEEVLAIEIKAGKTVAPAQLRGLRSFREVAHRRVHGFVVFTGERAQRLDGDVRAVPYAEFLLETLPALAGA